jgi:hypothetical protein
MSIELSVFDELEVGDWTPFFVWNAVLGFVGAAFL